MIVENHVKNVENLFFALFFLLKTLLKMLKM